MEYQVGNLKWNQTKIGHLRNAARKSFGSIFHHPKIQTTNAITARKSLPTNRKCLCTEQSTLTFLVINVRKRCPIMKLHCGIRKIGMLMSLVKFVRKSFPDQTDIGEMP